VAKLSKPLPAIIPRCGVISVTQIITPIDLGHITRHLPVVILYQGTRDKNTKWLIK